MGYRIHQRRLRTSRLAPSSLPMRLSHAWSHQLPNCEALHGAGGVARHLPGQCECRPGSSWRTRMATRLTGSCASVTARTRTSECRYGDVVRAASRLACSAVRILVSFLSASVFIKEISKA